MENFTEIEKTAIANFISQAKSVDSEKRVQIISKMTDLCSRGECPFYKGSKISIAAVKYTIDEIKAL